MRFLKATRYVALLGLIAIVVAACDDNAAELSTTSSLVSGPAPTGESTTTSVTPDGGESTTTSLVGQSVDGHEIVARESDTAGETLYIVIPPGAYTEVDIENFVLDLVEGGTATFGAEVFDDATAVEAYRKPEAERTEEDAALVAEHHFVSLQNGTTMVFRGPFEASGELVIGS
jgi:hypothetical protein